MNHLWTTFNRIRALIVKELQALLGDPQGRRLLIMPVILQTALYPFATTLEVKNNTLAVLNEDSGQVSVELIERFAQAAAFTKVLRLDSQRDLKRAIDNQDALVALVFPFDFSRKLAAGQSPVLQAVLDGRRSNSGQIALGYIQTIIQNYSAQHLRELNRAPISDIVVRHWFNPNLDYKYFTLPSLVAIITTISALVVTSLSVAREREEGTFDQLLVSPLTPGMIMIGKAAPALLVAFVQSNVILLAGVFIYRIPFQGSILLLYGSMFFYALALIGFGLLISSICSTQQQAFLGVFSFMMPAVLLSGYSSPIENMPEWLQIVTWANPLRHFIVIVKSIFLKDVSAGFVLQHVWPLVVISAVTLAAANWAFRHRLS